MGARSVGYRRAVDREVPDRHSVDRLRVVASSDPARSRPRTGIVVGNDVWIGHNAVVMGGVTLGDGAVVGAGAVVTHDVAPYEIVGGVPARHIGWRYAPEVIAAMERIRWWDWSHETLKERLRDFDDVERFCARYDIGQK